MVKDSVKRLFQFLTKKENPLALVGSRVNVRRNKRVKSVTHASIKGTQVKDRRMQDKLVEKKVAVRQSKEVALVEMLGSIKRLEQEGSVRRIGYNKAIEVEVKHGRVNPPIVKSASVGYRAESGGIDRVE